MTSLDLLTSSASAFLLPASCSSAKTPPQSYYHTLYSHVSGCYGYRVPTLYLSCGTTSSPPLSYMKYDTYRVILGFNSHYINLSLPVAVVVYQYVVVFGGTFVFVLQWLLSAVTGVPCVYCRTCQCVYN